MQRPSPQTNISTGNFPAPVGYQFMPQASGGVQVMPGGNAPAMRPTYSFLPVNQDDINQRMAADQDTWRRNNPNLASCNYPGLDLYGTGNAHGAGNCEASCPDGQRWRSDNQRCECKGSTHWCEAKGKCQNLFEYMFCPSR
jgi:hypothetical protein